MLMLGCKESTVPLLVVKGLRAETPINYFEKRDQNFVLENSRWKKHTKTRI